MWPQRRYYCSLPVSVKKARGYWAEDTNQRQFFNELAQQLGISQPSDWYRVRRTDVIKRGGKTIFNKYASLPLALKAVYPEYEWQDSFFVHSRKVPHRHWQRKSNLIDALTRAEKSLGIQQPEDWYSVGMTDLREVGFPYGVTKLQLSDLLGMKYPGFAWEKVFLLRGKYAQQNRLEKSLTSLFPEETIIRNARKEAGLVNLDSGDYFELDAWIPSLSLAFEFQERHHYVSSPEYASQPLQIYKERDRKKLELAEQKGITLILVPFWWDGRIESLVATIKARRPDLLGGMPSTNEDPIPKEIPHHLLTKSLPSIEGIGQPTTACFLTQTSIDPSKWWILEKYDGVRGFWNPEKKTFYSRQGNAFDLPQDIIDSMPTDLFLDGELWFGRDNFQEAMKLIHRANASDIDWPNFKYMVFDVPNHKGTYSERYQLLVDRLEKGDTANPPHPFIEVARKEACMGIDHLEKVFQDILDAGGEGIILRDPTSPYMPGRSPGYLKHKKFRDAEAKVIGSVGTQQWECELPNGVRFTAAAGTTEFGKRWDPQPGDIVSFKHRGYLLLTKKPKLPTLHRVRHDLTWEQVVHSWKEFKPSTSRGISLKRSAPRNRPKGYWKSQQNRREFFCGFAKKQGFDPMLGANWKRIKRSQIEEHKGVGVLSHFNGDLRKSLMDAFPEVNFDFAAPKKQNRYWQDVHNIRKFCDFYAKEQGFDPLNPNNWHDTVFKDLLTQPGAHSISRYNGGLKAAVQRAYPEIPVFGGKQKGPNKWVDPHTCREFFDAFAKEQGFDPLISTYWQNMHLPSLKTRKGGEQIQLHNGGFRKALLLAYPELRRNQTNT